MMGQVDVRTEHGVVHGRTTTDGVSAFLGIPYAAAPTGPLRFQPPQPPQPWSAPRDATEYGPTAPQAESSGSAAAELLPNVVIPGDDYLNLNVWTPDVAGNAPVMVFVHGGSFTSGSGAVPIYDGTRFARSGVVLVTINYRLGADGFLWFGDGTPNLGLLDQIAALTWVRDNIARFGGDPGNVTIFGESAGAMSVCTLLAMPAAQGLFHRAIAESGAGHSVISPESARLIGARLAAILGVEPSREAIAQVPVSRVIAAQLQLAGEVGKRPKAKLWGDVAANLMPFEPVVDGDVLPTRPVDALVAGVNPTVDLLIGSNSDETNLFFVPSGVTKRINRFLLGYLVRGRFGAGSVLRAYRAARPTAKPGELLCGIATDWYYRIPLLRIAEARPRTYVYEFGWGSPALDGALGACHAIELPFVFGTLDDPAVAPLIGAQAPTVLAERVQQTWVQFATTGDPGWPAYEQDKRAEMYFDTESELRVDPRPVERASWTGVR
jgi:para-nitrobenzyl esterase